MITPSYCRLMARYNAWQNQWMFAVADDLPESEREADRGAFWGGIRSTLSHLMWGDTIWISRFDGGAGPDTAIKASSEAYDWPAIMAGRPKLDARIEAWASAVTQGDLDGDLEWYSGASGRDMSKPYALCVIQLFNHQTHHRGQVHAMLTAAGVATQDTDLPFMPEDIPQWR